MIRYLMLVLLIFSFGSCDTGNKQRFNQIVSCKVGCITYYNALSVQFQSNAVLKSCMSKCERAFDGKNKK